MGWFTPTKQKRHLIRTETGKLIANINGDCLNTVLRNVNANDLKVVDGKYVFQSADGFKLGNNGIEVYLWKGFTIDCIPIDIG